MYRLRHVVALVLATALPWVPSLAQQPGHGGKPAKNDRTEPRTVPAQPAPVTSAADDAMMTGMQKMSQDMAAVPMTGDPDQDFVAMMIPHHRGAIDMARVELRYGKDPAMRRLASQIVAAQAKEIADMQHWQINHPHAR